MKLLDFDYFLPKNLIAQHPAPRRVQSRLMVLDRGSRIWEHCSFSDLPRYLKPGDVLVLNETKVLPARLIGEKRTGGKIEILLVRKRGRQGDVAEKSLQEADWIRMDGAEEWECLVRILADSVREQAL
jgi:S-adenosylmethionine:tRNA-ribosyltransferase-isomerase (queuine synthetase)